MKLLVAGLILVAFAGCLSDESFAPVPAPDLEVGQTWDYSSEAHFDFDGKFRVNGMDIDPAEGEFAPPPETWTETLVGNLSDTYVLHTDNAWSNNYMGLRKADHALQHLQRVVFQGGEVIFAESYEESEQPLQFPLTAGDSWVVKLGMEEFSLEVHYRVGGLSSITVPAGTFQAVHVHAEVPDIQVLFELELEDEAEFFDDFSVVTSFDAYYAPEVGRIIMDEWSTEISIRAQFQEEGANVDIDGIMTESQRTELTSFGMGAVPEPVPGAGVQILPEGVPFDPNGTVEPAVLSPLTGTINAATGESIEFTVDNAEGPFEWTVWRNGLAAQTTSAESFTFAPEEPGRYQIDVLNVGIASVVANYAIDEDLTCEAVQAGTGCDAIRFPIVDGMVTGSVQLDSGINGEAGVPGDFVLSFGGAELVTETEDGTATVDVTLYDQGFWDATWVPSAGVLQEGTVTIDLDYGEPDDESEPFFAFFVPKLPSFLGEI